MGMQERSVVCQINRNGYWVLDDGRILHRVLCRRLNGHFNPQWVVHHCDGDKLNNKKENLLAIPPSFHNSLHRFFGYKECLFDRERTIQLFYQFQRDRRGTERTMKLAARFHRRALKEKIKVRESMRAMGQVKIFVPRYIVRKKK